jgi:hypothetical protein
MLELAPFIELTGSKSKLFIWLYLKMILSKDNLIFLWQKNCKVGEPKSIA